MVVHTKNLTCIVLFFCPLALIYGSVEPFGLRSTGPFEPRGGEWIKTVMDEKPYFLEIAYGETDAPVFSKMAFDPETGLPSTDESPNVAPGAQAIPDSSLRELRVVTISVSGDDKGAVRQKDGAEVIYRIEEERTGFDLQLFLKTPGQEINTSIFLSPTETEWLSIGGGSQRTTRTDATGAPESGMTYRTVAVRLVRANNPGSGERHK